MADTTIPKIIHQYWTSSDGSEPPADIQANIDAWRRTHPGFEIKLWSDSALDAAFSDDRGANFLAAARTCRFAAMRSDVIRLALVLRFGGIWSDLKNRPLTEFLPDLVNEGRTFFAEHPPSTARPEPRDYICNQLFGARANDPMVFDCLSEAVDSIRRRVQGSVYGVTGGAMLMKVIARANNRGVPHDFAPLRYNETWGTLVKRTAASYNAGGMHWSERQKSESLYLP